MEWLTKACVFVTFRCQLEQDIEIQVIELLKPNKRLCKTFEKAESWEMESWGVLIHTGEHQKHSDSLYHFPAGMVQLHSGPNAAPLVDCFYDNQWLGFIYWT